MKLDCMAVLELGKRLFAVLIGSSLAVDEEGATSSACLRDVLEPEGRIIGFSSPIALPLPASVILNSSSGSSRERLLF